MEAKQTPLIDLLERVPLDAVLVVEHDQFDSGSHPIGRLCHEAAAELRRLHAEVERLRTDGASAVRWAPGSAYWSDVLRELFGPNARDGINVVETRWRAELERADTAEALLRQATDLIETLRDCANALGEFLPRDHPYLKIVDQANRLLDEHDGLDERDGLAAENARLREALQAILDEVTPGLVPYSSDSYLPVHLVEQARAALGM